MLLTTRQVAARLGVSDARVRQLLAEGRLRATKLGRDWLIEERSLEAVAVRKPGRPGWQPRKP
jgi:excisionase family DNA binding protein